MKTDHDQRLKQILAKARQRPDEEATDEISVRPGIATRIASRWAAGADRPTTAFLFERVTACFAVPAVIAFTLVWWQHPQPEPAAHDLMSALFDAKLEVGDDLPF